MSLVWNGCSYLNCPNTRSNSEMTFFKFPRKPFLRKVWVENCGNLDLVDLNERQLNNKLLCDVHFESKYLCCSKTRKVLIRNAVPVHFCTKQEVETELEIIRPEKCYTNKKRTDDLEHPSKNEYDLFGDYISKQLQELPGNVAKQLQIDIQALLTNSKLKFKKETLMESLTIIKEEPIDEEILPIKIENLTELSDQCNQIRSTKRPVTENCTATVTDERTDFPTFDTKKVKQEQYEHTSFTNVMIDEKNQNITIFNSTGIKKDQQNENEQTSFGIIDNRVTNKFLQNENERTDFSMQNEDIKVYNNTNKQSKNMRNKFTIFAHHISRQMVTLPQETALKLQTKFNELLTRASNGLNIETERLAEISEEIDCDFTIS